MSASSAPAAGSSSAPAPSAQPSAASASTPAAANGDASTSSAPAPPPPHPLDGLSPTDLRNKLDNSRQDLRQFLERKRKIDRDLATLEASIYAFEGSYLSDNLLPASSGANAASTAAAQFGNIIRGYDSYLKAPAGGGGDRKRGRVGEGANEKERMFSASSATYQRSLDLRQAEIAASVMSESEEDASSSSRRKRSRTFSVLVIVSSPLGDPSNPTGSAILDSLLDSGATTSAAVFKGGLLVSSAGDEGVNAYETQDLQALQNALLTGRSSVEVQGREYTNTASAPGYFQAHSENGKQVLALGDKHSFAVAEYTDDETAGIVTSELEIRKLDAQTTIFSAPFSRMGLPFGGRSTAVTLKNDDVFLAASHPLDPATLDTITSLGNVKHIVMLDSEHGMYTKQYTDAFPQATLYLPPGGHSKWESKGYLPSDSSKYFVFGREPTTGDVGAAGTNDPLAKATDGEIQSADFSKAFVNEDLAFYHAPTKTVIEADLLFNLPPTEQYSRSSSRSSLPVISDQFKPGTTAHQRFLYNVLAKDKAEMTRMAKRVAGWDFNRIIPCHGDVIEADAKKAWLDTYKLFLEHN
ncbi:hypothetical protein JCM8097_007741 [Rhodosporidiobolus ruineniae]